MTGPQHYYEAERLLEFAAEDANIGGEEERYSLAAAQVHAMLALTAATAIANQGKMPMPASDAWLDAAS